MKIAPGSLRAKLFWAFALVTVLAAVLSAAFLRNALYQERLRATKEQVLARAAFAKAAIETHSDEARLHNLFDTARALSFRMTLLNAAGQVELDSHMAPGAVHELDNHNDRPEIEAARAKGTGISQRYSDTLGIVAVYAAVSLENGSFLRVAVPLEDVRRALDKEFSFATFSITWVIAFCLLLSVLITRKVRDDLNKMAEVVAMIARDKGKRRLLEVPGKEFLPLAHAVNHMADSIEEYLRATGDQQTQLEAILNGMHEGVLVLGPLGKIRRWNKAFAALFPGVVACFDKPLIELIPIVALQRRIDSLLSEDQAATPDEAIHFERPSGRFLVAHISRPVTPNDSLGAVIVIYDATEIMRLESVRRDFVSNVSHELRTPLTAIAGYAETLASSEDLNGKYREFAVIINKHATILARIISDLLALARVENTREAIAIGPAPVAPIIKNAIAACAAQVDAKHIQIAVDLDDTAVLANAPLMTQVFRNLLENACRYSPESDTVRVTAKREGANVLFIVTDNGPGIPAEALPRIFERFYQVKKERNSGTAGIGLAICKHIVERHGGRIWAESPHRDAATAMLFTLPAVPEHKVSS